MLHSFIAAAVVLARIGFTALGETVRIVGSMFMLAMGQPGIRAEQPAAADPQDDQQWFLVPTATAKVSRVPLARDVLTGALV